ncbi:MAG: hypothetical protein ACRC9X_01155, partial [Bacteroidales bacterium]
MLNAYSQVKCNGEHTVEGIVDITTNYVEGGVLELPRHSTAGLPVDYYVEEGTSVKINSLGKIEIVGLGTSSVMVWADGGTVNGVCYPPLYFDDHRFFTVTITASPQTIDIKDIKAPFYPRQFSLPSINTSAGLPVSYRIVGGSSPVFSLSNGNVVNISTVGTVPMEAFNNGDNKFVEKVVEPFIVEIIPASQTINVVDINRVYGSGNYTFPFVSSSSCPVTYSVVPNDIVSLSGTRGEIAHLNKVGSVVVTASVANCPNYLPMSTTFTLSVEKASQSILGTKDLAVPYSEGGTFDLVGASATSGLEVKYRLSANTPSDVISITGNKVSIQNAGEAQVVAFQSGDNNYAAANEVVFTITISKIDQVLHSDLSDITKVYGSGNFELLNRVTSANLPIHYVISNNSVVDLVEPRTVQILSAGETEYEAYCSGDKNYNDVSEKFKIVILRDTQTINISNLIKTYGDEDFLLPFVASKGATVIYSLEALTDVISLGGERNATVSIKNAGTAKVKATLNDPNYYPVDTVFPIVVNKVGQVISGVSNIVKTYTPNGSFTLSGISNSALPVTYRLADGEKTNVVSISGSTVNIHNVGTVSVIAYQQGNENYLPALECKFDITIEQAEQTIDPISEITKLFDVEPFELDSLTTSKGNLIYYRFPDNGTSSVVSLTGKLVSILKVGTVVIEAYNDNKNYKFVSTRFTLKILTATQKINVSNLQVDYGASDFVLPFQSNKDSTVTYRLHDDASLDVISLNGDRNATVSVGNVGEVTVSAMLDCPNYYRVDTTFTITVNKVKQNISNISDISETYSPNGTFEFSGVTSAKYLEVNYRLADDAKEDIISIEEKKVTILNAGSVKVIAYQWGDRNYLSADSVVFVVTIEQAEQTLPVDSLKDITKVYNSENFELSKCFTSADAQVLYYLPKNSVVSLIGEREIGILSAGKVKVYAYRFGDKNYKDVSDSLMITILKDSQTINVDNLLKSYGDDNFDLEFKSSKDSTIIYSVSGDVVNLSGESNATVSIQNAGV